MISKVFSKFQEAVIFLCFFLLMVAKERRENMELSQILIKFVYKPQ